MLDFSCFKSLDGGPWSLFSFSGGVRVYFPLSPTVRNTNNEYYKNPETKIRPRVLVSVPLQDKFKTYTNILTVTLTKSLY